MASGTTIGYKRLLRFPPVTARAVRLRILSSRLNPTIAEFGAQLALKLQLVQPASSAWDSAPGDPATYDLPGAVQELTNAMALMQCTYQRELQLSSISISSALVPTLSSPTAPSFPTRITTRPARSSRF